jgi:hypothetical protein
MEKKNIESGILELYVYGLSETENEEVTTMEKTILRVNAEMSSKSDCVFIL